jgi:hypothetical protein
MAQNPRDRIADMDVAVVGVRDQAVPGRLEQPAWFSFGSGARVAAGSDSAQENHGADRDDAPRGYGMGRASATTGPFRCNPETYFFCAGDQAG